MLYCLDCLHTLLISAILITGGYPFSATTELFVPSTGDSCQLPSLPVPSYGHIQNGYLACGGRNTGRNCLLFDDLTGTWNWTPIVLRHYRMGHVSWSFGEDTLLMGGEHSEMSTELVLQASISMDDIILKYPTRYVPSIYVAIVRLT